MEEKSENNDKKKSKKKRILLLVILALLLLIPGVYFLISFRSSNNNAGEAEVANSENVDVAEENQTADANADEQVNENPVAENVEIESAADEEMVSENYRVSQVKFGGNAVIENGHSRDVSLEIYQVKSETFISQEDEDPRILISWKTNKEAISTVNYSKADGKSVINANEDGYGFEHTMLLTNMEFSTIYTYQIESRDKWGNKVNTEYFSAYTGDKSESIFDLITNAVEDVFGWAMK